MGGRGGGRATAGQTGAAVRLHVWNWVNVVCGGRGQHSTHPHPPAGGLGSIKHPPLPGRLLFYFSHMLVRTLAVTQVGVEVGDGAGGGG